MGFLVCVPLSLALVVPAQAPPRGPRPKPAGAVAPTQNAAESALRKQIADSPPDDADPYLRLAALQERRGATAEAEGTLHAARQALPNERRVLDALGGFYTRAGDFDRAIAALEASAQVNAGDPDGHHRVATSYYEKAISDSGLSADQKRTYLVAGVAAADRVLALDTDHVEGLVYKNLLLRVQANLETDSLNQQRLLAEADVLRSRAQALRPGKAVDRATVVPGAPPPPPPPPPPANAARAVDGDFPIRVGGNVKPPTKVQDVRPIYPADALANRTQGAVILEVTIDAAGLVRDARVLRSIPVLDGAAVDAVRQWVFEPTLLNGRAVPVIMTVTVNFTLEQ